MKFKQILTIGIDESDLSGEYWKRIDDCAEKRVSLPKDSLQIKEYLTGSDCLLVKFNPVSKEWIDGIPNLKYIGVLATGYGKIPTDYTKEKGVVVTNVPGYSTESVAEFVFAVLLENLRELSRAKIEGGKGNYSEAGFFATEIKNKSFAVIGAGRIGTRVAEIAQGFGADVRYWDRNNKKELEAKGVKLENIDNIFSKSDIVSVHLALTKETQDFFNSERINSFKKGVIIVNTAPMELFDLGALERRLEEGGITFILDHSDEMKKEDLNRVSKYKNCVIYPPIAYISDEARINKQEIFIDNLKSFLDGELKNKV